MSKSTITLPVKGMTCASCVAHVEGALKEVPGVEDARVNLATEQATVRYLAGTLIVADLARVIEGAGYQVLGAPPGCPCSLF